MKATITIELYLFINTKKRGDRTQNSDPLVSLSHSHTLKWSHQRRPHLHRRRCSTSTPSELSKSSVKAPPELSSSHTTLSPSPLLTLPSPSSLSTNPQPPLSAVHGGKSRSSAVSPSKRTKTLFSLVS